MFITKIHKLDVHWYRNASWTHHSKRIIPLFFILILITQYHFHILIKLFKYLNYSVSRHLWAVRIRALNPPTLEGNNNNNDIDQPKFWSIMLSIRLYIYFFWDAVLYVFFSAYLHAYCCDLFFNFLCRCVLTMKLELFLLCWLV